MAFVIRVVKIYPPGLYMFSTLEGSGHRRWGHISGGSGIYSQGVEKNGFPKVSRGIFQEIVFVSGHTIKFDFSDFFGMRGCVRLMILPVW